MREFLAEIQQTAQDEPVRVTIIAPEEIRSLPAADAEERLSSMVNQFRVRPESTVYRFGVFASYVEPKTRDRLDGHNTLVDVSLPYTLHLPSNMPFRVQYPQVPGAATIRARKIWTNLAAGSNEAEGYADDQLLYYGPAQPQPPNIPQAPELGPWPQFTGTNVEIQGDTHGVFRYSQVRVLFDGVYTGIDGEDDSEPVKAARSVAVAQAIEAASLIVNYLLDVYRDVTRENHVERLARMLVTRVYFADSNLVYESVGIESGLGPAIVNRSRREIQTVRQMLANGIEPERHALLMQSARSALDRGQNVLAVVVAFQAQEIFIEQRLRAGYLAQSLTDADITQRLKDNYRTKDRLTTLSREITGGKSVADDSQYWRSWLTDCNGRRNGVVHRGDEIGTADAKRLVELCEECISRFAAL